MSYGATAKQSEPAIDNGKYSSSKCYLNRIDRQDITSTNQGILKQHQDTPESNQIRNNIGINRVLPGANFDRFSSQSTDENMLINTRSAVQDDAKMFSELYATTNYTAEKSKAPHSRLFKKNSQKGFSSDYRSINLQETGKKALGMKIVLSPTKIEDRKSRQDMMYPTKFYANKFSNHHAMTQNESRLTKKGRVHTVSPERSSQLTKDSSYEKNEFMESFKKARVKIEAMKPIHSRKGPMLLISSQKKKRTQSENRNRNFDDPTDNEDAEYFSNKLKSTLKIPGNGFDHALFFSKRKANQNFGSTKPLNANENPFMFGKSFTEKKSLSTFIPLHRVKTSNASEMSANNGEPVCANLYLTRFENTSNFGGENILKVEDSDATNSNYNLHSNGSEFGTRRPSQSTTESNMEEQYHCTFFPKGKLTPEVALGVPSSAIH